MKQIPLLLIALFIIFSLGGREAAASPAHKKKAIALYKAATQLYKAARYRAAIKKYKASHALHPHLNNIYYLAESHRRLGNLRRSHDYYTKFTSMLPEKEQRIWKKKLEKLRLSKTSVLSVASQPGSAFVEVGGAHKGLTPADGTPLKITVPGGEHTVTVKLLDHLSVTKKIKAEFSEPLALSFALKPLPRRPKLTVQTNVKGALVLLDNKPMGKTPLNVEAAPGRHMLVILLPGYQRLERDLVLKAGVTERLSLQLTPLPKPSKKPAPADDPKLVMAPIKGPPPPGLRQNKITIQAFVGPSWMDFGDDSVDLGVGTEFGLELGYLWRWPKVGLHLFATALAMPISDKTTTVTTGSETSSWFVSALAGLGLRWYFVDQAWGGLSFGLGVGTLFGASVDSFFFDDKFSSKGIAEISGAFPAVAIRPALTAGWTIYKGLTLYLTPIAVDYSPAHADFTDNIDYVLRYHVSFGLGWQI